MPTYILGASAFYHDSAACLIRDAEIVAVTQEERFTRGKFDARVPTNAIRYYLGECGMSPDVFIANRIDFSNGHETRACQACRRLYRRTGNEVSIADESTFTGFESSILDYPV